MNLIRIITREPTNADVAIMEAADQEPLPEPNTPATPAMSKAAGRPASHVRTCCETNRVFSLELERLP